MINHNNLLTNLFTKPSKFFFLDFWDPPTIKKKKYENFTYGVSGIRIG